MVLKQKVFCEVIRQGKCLDLFDELNKNKFNGKIFELTDEEKKLLEDTNLEQLAVFLEGKNENGQYIIWENYSFKHLPIELISSIYEEFLESEKGVVYTPPFLVNFLIDECMPINKPKGDYEIIDPACGSGVFLVAAFKRLVDWWRLDKYKKKGIVEKPTVEDLKSILKKSIFGVDKNGEAVRIATFSLSLALCDMLTPYQIWHDLKFDNLREENITKNDFFGYLGKKKKFDLVIGNPPFEELNTDIFEGILSKNNLTNDYKIPQNQISLLFLTQSIGLLKNKDSLLCFIQPSGPLLYNNSKNAIEFRQKLFSSRDIPQILDFTQLTNLFSGRKKINKESETTVGTAAIFLHNIESSEQDILHITIRNTKVTNEHLFFDIDSYDFHYIDKDTAIHDPNIWKSNQLGGGRMSLLINRLDNIKPKLKEYLKEKSTNSSWAFGDGFIKGKPDSQIIPEDLIKKKGSYEKAPFLTNSLYFEPEDFDENGIKKKGFLTDIYFQWKRKPDLFKQPLVLIKKNLGLNSIPVIYIEENIAFKNEVIGIHSPIEDKEELREIELSIKNNKLYQFYLLVTSSRAGISRSVKTLLQKDILNLPYPAKKEELKLSYTENILVEDVLNYQIELFAGIKKAKAKEQASSQELSIFAEVLCYALNSLYGDGNKSFYYNQYSETDSYICAYFKYGKNLDNVPINNGNSLLSETDIHDLVYNETGKNVRITRLVILYRYKDDTILIIKPKQLRYWLRSIALRDADSIISSFFTNGY